jgi:hypothetical protein
MMAISDAIGIDMPGDFPCDAHNAVVKALAPYQPRNPDICSELAAGWNAVAIRFKTVANADGRFTASISSKGAFASSDERHAQEEALFAFFVNGYAAVESLAYAAFAMGAMLRPMDFPMITPGNLRAVTPNTTKNRFTTCFPGTPIEVKFSSLIADQNFERWGLIRNVLAHRSAPPRHHHISVGSNAPDKTDWEVIGGLALNDQTAASNRSWLATTLTDCVEAAAAFATSNFP